MRAQAFASRVGLCSVAVGLWVLLASCGDDTTAAARPRLDAPVEGLDFGPVPVLNEKKLTLTFANVGRAPLTVLRIAAVQLKTYTVTEEGAEQGETVTVEVEQGEAPFRVGEVPAEIGPGAELLLEVFFKPREEVAYARTLVVETDDPDQPRVELPLVGVGSTRAVMEVEPLVLDFGRVAEGTSAVKSFRIRSTGSADLILEELAFAEGSSEAFSFVGSTRTPAVVEAKTENGANGEIQLTVKYTVALGAPDTATGAVRIRGTDPDQPELLVQLTGTVNRAPLAVIAPIGNAAPGMTVNLDGSGSSDPDGDLPLTYKWTLKTRPLGAEAQLGAADQATTTLQLDPKIPGAYEVELLVTDAAGAKSQPPARLAIIASPAQKLLVEMFWNNTVTDIDLHVLRSPLVPVGQPPGDCFYANKTPDWGEAGNPADDPEFLRDALTGYGPEVFAYVNPIDTTYRVVVEYAHDHLAADPNTEITVRIYEFGVVKGEFKKTLGAIGQVWSVADVEWPSGAITPLEGN